MAAKLGDERVGDRANDRNKVETIPTIAKIILQNLNQLFCSSKRFLSVCSRTYTNAKRENLQYAFNREDGSQRRIEKAQHTLVAFRIAVKLQTQLYRRWRACL